MTGTIFDLVEADLPEGKKGYMEFANRAPEPKDDSFINTISDYGKTILKGSVEGVSKLGAMMGRTSEYPDVIVTGKKSQQTPEEQTEMLDVLLPTDEGFVQRGLRRGLKEAPTAMSFPVGGSAIQTLPRAIGAGFLGEGAKEFGMPEWAQAAAELTAYIGPDITKKLLSAGKDKELIEFAKKMGMTDEQITPLLQSENKQKWLTKLTPKRGATQRALKSTKEALGETYSTLQKSESAGLEITEKENGKLINAIREKLSEMPRELQGKIEADLNDLLNNKITGQTLINFYKDIGSHFGENTKQLSLLKEPVKEALRSISPKLADDFEMINKLYTKYYPIAAKLKPNITSDIISAAEALGIGAAGFGVLFGHYPSMLAILGEKSARILSQQLLLNPRFQQLSQKMVVAINQNKYGLAKKIIDDVKKEVSKFSPESAQKIQNLSEEEFEKLIKYQE